MFNDTNNKMKTEIPSDLRPCIAFHGHLCPGLVYGYIVAKECIRLLGITRSHDEEIVAICENDSCAVDGLQVMLGTTAGKGNLIIKDYGKNAYTIINRAKKEAYRLSKKSSYVYTGKDEEEFKRLEKAVSENLASEEERRRQKYLKALDLLSKPLSEVFFTTKVEISMPPYAPLAPSITCGVCGEMTMQTKTILGKDGSPICIPCSHST